MLELSLVVLVGLLEIEVFAALLDVVQDFRDTRVDRRIAGVDLMQETRRDVHAALEIGWVRFTRQ